MTVTLPSNLLKEKQTVFHSLKEEWEKKAKGGDKRFGCLVDHAFESSQKHEKSSDSENAIADWLGAYSRNYQIALLSHVDQFNKSLNGGSVWEARALNLLNGILPAIRWADERNLLEDVSDNSHGKPDVINNFSLPWIKTLLTEERFSDLPGEMEEAIFSYLKTLPGIQMEDWNAKDRSERRTKIELAEGNDDGLHLMAVKHHDYSIRVLRALLKQRHEEFVTEIRESLCAAFDVPVSSVFTPEENSRNSADEKVFKHNKSYHKEG